MMYSFFLTTMLSHLFVGLCLLFIQVAAVLVNIDRYKGEIQRTHNMLRSWQNAADMKYMYWDSDLEARAGQWSEGCRFEHQMRGYGENLAFMSSTGPAPRPRETIMDGIRNWYNEISLWQRRSPQQRLQFCGAACHYTQLVWSRTSRLGCTLSYCPVLVDDRGSTYRNAMYFVCFYDPQGNIVGQPVFTPGPPCTRCPGGREPCRNGLCAGPDIARRFRRSAAITESWMCQSPKVKCSSPNVPEKCPTKCSSENEG
ncbi:cysteine-rich secretory protein LCCL domain-containing 2-like [Mytilus edulis]|uniref:cysteine-rich secretory protein LCCL domain-containing 2-like n=1 Tax=Mytilus edulis TaxID=6550 RepID=UPI0039F05C5D